MSRGDHPGVVPGRRRTWWSSRSADARKRCCVLPRGVVRSRTSSSPSQPAGGRLGGVAVGVEEPPPEPLAARLGEEHAVPEGLPRRRPEPGGSPAPRRCRRRRGGTRRRRGRWWRGLWSGPPAAPGRSTGRAAAGIGSPGPPVHGRRVRSRPADWPREHPGRPRPRHHRGDGRGQVPPWPARRPAGCPARCTSAATSSARWWSTAAPT